MASVRELLSKLKQPYRDQAISNYANTHGEESLNDYSGSLVGTINRFTWAESPQGQGYWEHLSNSIRAKGNSSEFIDNTPFFLTVPGWLKTKEALTKHLHKKFNMDPDHQVQLICTSYTASMDSSEFLKKYHAGFLNDKRKGGIFIYKNKIGEKVEDYCLYEKAGIRVLFKVRVPRSATNKEVSAEILAARELHNERFPQPVNAE